eukprot:scaffold191446_cov46-Prasinocladus_malaysianus.AAC.3
MMTTFYSIFTTFPRTTGYRHNSKLGGRRSCPHIHSPRCRFCTGLWPDGRPAQTWEATGRKHPTP